MLQRFSVLLVLLGVLGSSALAQNQPTNNPPRTCAQFVPLGKLYVSQGLFDQAYIAFRSCVTLEPKNTEALLLLGNTEIRLKLFSAAIEHFKQCVATDAKYWLCYVAMADAYRNQWRNSSDRARQLALLDEGLKILDDAERIATTNESKGSIANMRGNIYKDRGDVAKAVQAFERAAQLRPDAGVIWFNLGTLYVASNQLTKAIEALKKAINLMPRDAEFRAYLARALRERNQTGDLTEAADQATQAYNLCGGTRCKNSFVVGQYGIVLYLQNNLNLSHPVLEQAVKADTGNIYHENSYFLGRVYMQLGRAKDAKGQFSRALVLDVDNQLYWFWIGQSNEALGEKEAACKSYAKAIELAGGVGQNKEAERANAALKCK
ncbi:MAG: tetratricopeptide repeat protein [Deinococcales bacterium]